MGKARGVSKRRRKKYDYKVNKKKLHRKLLRLPGIKCKPMKESWEKKKSVLRNFKEMGISADPNEALKFKTTKEMLEPMNFDEEMECDRKPEPKPSKSYVIEDLEKEATAPQPKRFRLPLEVIRYCIYMIEKYGDDYKAMARDPKNYYQDTPRQIKRKIHRFKTIPEQWNAYLRAKNENVDMDTIFLSEDEN